MKATEFLWFISGLALATSSATFAKDPTSLATMSSDQQEAALTYGFRSIDRNQSGFIEVAEAPTARKTVRRGDIIVRTESGAKIWIEGFDTNRDGVVSLSEYVSRAIGRLGSK